MRIPNHVGVIPDGNRRWAEKNGYEKEMGYRNGLTPGLEIFKLCEKVGIKELTFYGFTVDNTKRPNLQKVAFTNACVQAVKMLSKENASLLVIGNYDSPMFPSELLPFTKRKDFGKGGMKINFLVNYGWEWDVMNLSSSNSHSRKSVYENIKSKDISRVDLIMRWGGRRRLSGFLPVQSVYSDFYIIDEMWPDFDESQFNGALEWYSKQDITLGG
jgi:undecaprenyl diphosphate synthase